MDRHSISEQSLLELPADDGAPKDEDTSVTPPARSAKMAELVRYLCAFDKDDKTLVFSQFTSFLDRVAAILDKEGIAFCRFDGSMTAKKVGNAF
jgi:SWI/SNF-related matrix-associated actin-dependent regulator of chromatin subfamily A3